MILVSCDYKDANGPKVSQETLQIELNGLFNYAVTDQLSALKKITVNGDLDSLSYEKGYAKHPTADIWELYYGWTTGSSDFPRYHIATEPFVFFKRDDGSWTITYHGGGTYLDQYNDISFTTTLEPVPDGWNVKVKGVIADGEYTMDFGSDSLTITTDMSSSEFDYYESYLSGSFYLVTKKGGNYLDSLKGTLSSSRQNHLDYGFSSKYVAWQYLKISKPDWYTEE